MVFFIFILILLFLLHLHWLVLLIKKFQGIAHDFRAEISG